ncbi:membrane protein [Caballeronia catudaia]|uniref:Membrane protein n=1 Tax=Caballeronia catudaia TaxID=1777136 RepID=A0A158D3B9_9BURK|nr:DUF4148 domain-containing protein [Caballeronia catudaia]SAK89174.1 membrane protein [Caballeronia catudaia]
MNRAYHALLIAAALCLPLATQAQPQSTVTRAQVRAELVAAEQAGQFPQSDTRYPEPANYPVAVPHVFHRSHDVAATSYGPSANGSADSGFRATRARSFATAPIGFNDIYRGQ